MTLWRKILAAVDLGSDTEKVLAYALWLARSSAEGDAEVHLLHVMNYALTPPAYMMPYIEKEREADNALLKEWEQKIASQGIRTDHTFAVGRLVETFTASFRELSSDVLVLGHRSHLIRPSSSERLIRSLPIPLLVVRGGKAEGATLGATAIKRIVCAVDFSENSRRAMEAARSLAEKSSAALIMVHAVSSLTLERSFAKLQEISEAGRNEYIRHLLRGAEESLCSFLAGCSGVERAVTIGVPYKVINQTAAEKDADLIIMGAKGVSYIKEVLLGSVSEAVIKSSPCPVLIIR
ncbi:MAG: universal stress protein [Alphaproteobacteria bacterium]|uniref:Universal stress protein n=1 Tax=Candidatus Nitrobium versatile TaxID=2884831 RepID=A0A953JFM0_9BACT|nr:universal stress protein [Candidatus Nitrobium versatile]